MVRMRRIGRALAVAALACSWAAPAAAEDRHVTVASTTSTEASGLFDHILPIFEKETGIDVRVIAVGTGQALQLGKRGDVDVLLVHHRPSEDAFVAEGHGTERRDVMYNDFLLVGPAADAAQVKGLPDAVEALKRIAGARAAFVSRGDDSGTHKLEMALWSEGRIDASAASGAWYRSVGAGMDRTLTVAGELAGYTLVDRGTWLSFRRKTDLVPLVEGDARLHNPYGAILVSPERFPHVRAAEGRAFIAWLVSEQGQAAIRSFQIDGETLFTPGVRAPRATEPPPPGR